MSKLRMKISGSMRSMAGAEEFCGICSYLATAARHGIPPVLQAGTAVFDLTVGNSRVPRNRTSGLPMCPTELSQTNAAPLVAFADGLNTTLARLDPLTGPRRRRPRPRRPARAAGRKARVGRSVSTGHNRARRPVRSLRRFVIYPREGHLIRERNHQLDILRRTSAWFDRWLG